MTKLGMIQISWNKILKEPMLNKISKTCIIFSGRINFLIDSDFWLDAPVQILRMSTKT